MTATDAAEPVRPSRLRLIVQAPLRWLGILFVPDRVLPRVVGEGTYAGPMLVATMAALLAALTVGGRVDLSAKVLQQAAQQEDGPQNGAAAGQPNLSDREYEE